MRVLFALLALFALVSTAVACEGDDCNNNDCGTCSNGCCKLLISSDMEWSQLTAAISKLATSGGPDGLYALTSANTSYSAPGSLLMQLTHETRVNHYVDDLSIFTYPASWKAPEGTPQPPSCNAQAKTCVTAFSKSRVGWCDSGQNYSNLLMFWKALTADSSFEPDMIMFGCPPPSPSLKKVLKLEK